LLITRLGLLAGRRCRIGRAGHRGERAVRRLAHHGASGIVLPRIGLNDAGTLLGPAALRLADRGVAAENYAWIGHRRRGGRRV
jgi:hypothetical protein